MKCGPGIWQAIIPPETRFQLKIWPRGDCWEWRGLRTPEGYGFFAVEARSVSAHRHAYELAKGAIPLGLELDHLCRHRWCVKPSHLEAVTSRENILRGESLIAKQAKQTHCKRGHPFDITNTRVRPDGSRQCRLCNKLRQRQESLDRRLQILDRRLLRALVHEQMGDA